MELKDRLYLKEHYNNYETAKSGYLRNLDLEIMKTYERIYREYIDPRFILTIWEIRSLNTCPKLSVKQNCKTTCISNKGQLETSSD